MHTVITDLCTGCELCVEPCPVDCIDIIPTPEKSDLAKTLFAEQAHQRFEFRNTRLEKERIRDREKYLQAKQAGEKNKTVEERKAEIAAILIRTKRSN
jgi:electron transport complex protein RnfB